MPVLSALATAKITRARLESVLKYAEKCLAPVREGHGIDRVGFERWLWMVVEDAAMETLAEQYRAAAAAGTRKVCGELACHLLLFPYPWWVPPAPEGKGAEPPICWLEQEVAKLTRELRPPAWRREVADRLVAFALWLGWDSTRSVSRLLATLKPGPGHACDAGRPSSALPYAST
jgi:hypothetical protein